MRNFIPGSKVDHTGLRKTENRLKFLYSSSSGRAIKAIYRDVGNSRINGGDRIKLFLNLPYFLPGRANGKVLPRPGSRNAGYLFCRINVDAGTIKMAQNFNGAVASFSQRTGAPLGHPVWTGDLSSVTVLG